jgi:peroxiredoxin Q/BCP
MNLSMKLLTRSGALLIVAALFSSLACARAVTRPDGGVGMLPVGAAAPELVGIDGTGKTTKLSELRGHASVVYFYPKDGTPGCTKEACAFRDAWERYARAGVTIFGVSNDSPEKHQKFIAEHHLPFPLVSDESGDLARAYGVGTGLFGFSRVSFLVGADGRIVKIWPDVDPGVHATEVLAAAAP